MRYKPHEYQKYAVEYIKTHPAAAIFLDCGLGKTSITLTAIADLLFDSFEIHKVLVIAPLRVARDTWTAEADKWDHLQNLICSVAVGTEAQRRAALMRYADIYIINRENVQWLIDESGIPFDFDMVVIDELSSFKNVTGKLKWTNNGKEKSPTKYSLLSIMLVNIILERRKGNGEGKNVQRNTSLQANRIYNQEVCSSNRNRQKDSPKVLEYERRRIFKISGREP